ncbi:MAG: AAA family ATPase [Thermoguttaceae bacterium]|nr:AAA family ATPase [Thermoguttaceae bacterium]
MTPITQLTIHGFKSIQNLNEFELGNLNVLIGANGAGKSNFISWFEMMKALASQKLQHWIHSNGEPDRFLFNGVKNTKQIVSTIIAEGFKYHFKLELTNSGTLMFTEEQIEAYLREESPMPSYESYLLNRNIEGDLPSEIQNTPFFRNWSIYHFQDTTSTSGMVRYHSLHDNEYLRPNAENIAPFLYRIRQESPKAYQRIRKIVRLAAPFFDDFDLKINKMNSGEEQVLLCWTQIDSDYPFYPTQFSDGTLRFICLVTALLQPNPPSTILIDEPELGLHPYALVILGDLLRTASQRMQIIVSTQSVSLVNQFSIDDLIVVERQNGASTFQRLKEEDFQAWLEEYSTGELWEKNVLGGRLPQ